MLFRSKQNLYYAFKDASGLSIKLNDSLIYDDDQMYDFILANPPFGIKGLKYKDMCKVSIMIRNFRPRKKSELASTYGSGQLGIFSLASASHSSSDMPL